MASEAISDVVADGGEVRYRLLPCPFCGHEVSDEEAHLVVTGTVRGVGEYDALEVARAWNERAGSLVGFFLEAHGTTSSGVVMGSEKVSFAPT